MSKRFFSELEDVLHTAKREMPYKKNKKSPAKASRQKGNVSYIRGRVTSGPQGPELKQVDTTANAVVVSTAAPYLVSLLSGMPQGTTASNRIGDRIKVRSVMIRANIYSSATTLTPNFSRWSLVLDKQPDNVTATVGSIYTNSVSNCTQLTVANLERFQVLASGDVGTALSVAGPQGMHVDRYVKCDLGTRFPDATGEATTNGLYFVLTSNATVGNPVSLDYNIRVRWSDE